MTCRLIDRPGRKLLPGYVLTALKMLLCPLLPVFGSQAIGAIVYQEVSIRRNPDGSVPIEATRVAGWESAISAGALARYGIDFDGDGTAELSISSGDELGLQSPAVFMTLGAGVEVLAAPFFPPDPDRDPQVVTLLGRDAIRANTASLYDPSLLVQWAGSGFAGGAFGMLGQPLDVGQPGPFTTSGDERFYAGVRFLKDGEWHYGWIDAGGGSFGLTIYGFAWETVADRAIVAGVVPEASALALIFPFAGLAGLRRRRSGADRRP